MKKHTRTAYHHGSLQKALVEYTLKHVHNSGWEDFSMREATREIGVSPGAAYRHFKTLDDLLYEVAHLGFDMLDEKMHKKRQKALDAHEEIIGVGMAYIQFAKDEPHLFNLMFSDKIAKLHENNFQEECNSTDCEPLVVAIHNYLGPDTDTDIQSRCDFLWVIAHGIASLEATTGWQRSEVEKLAILEMGITALDVHDREKRNIQQPSVVDDD